jgi:hypothetical protein
MQHVSGRIEVKGSGGQTSATFTPWVGFFDPDETSSQFGVYVVYIFAEDLQSVALTLNQGIARRPSTWPPIYGPPPGRPSSPPGDLLGLASVACRLRCPLETARSVVWGRPET